MIDVQLDRFIAWMDGRYKSMDDGSVTEAQCAASRRSLVGDEWRAIRKNLPGAKDMPSAAARLLDILSEGRKAGICALAASHLDTAEGMGITGEKDMLKCFDMIIYLGAMATKYVLASARMARPAVVYDPEHDVWAQLIIARTYAVARLCAIPACGKPSSLVLRCNSMRPARSLPTLGAGSSRSIPICPLMRGCSCPITSTVSLPSLMRHVRCLMIREFQLSSPLARSSARSRRCLPKRSMIVGTHRACWSGSAIFGNISSAVRLTLTACVCIFRIIRVVGLRGGVEHSV